MLGSIGPMELLVIFLIVLLVFGADRLPELARGLGKGMREFRKATEDLKEEILKPEADALEDLKRELEDEAESTKQLIEDDYLENLQTDSIEPEKDSNELEPGDSEENTSDKKDAASSELAG